MSGACSIVSMVTSMPNCAHCCWRNCIELVRVGRGRTDQAEGEGPAVVGLDLVDQLLGLDRVVLGVVGLDVPGRARRERAVGRLVAAAGDHVDVRLLVGGVGEGPAGVDVVERWRHAVGLDEDLGRLAGRGLEDLEVGAAVGDVVLEQGELGGAPGLDDVDVAAAEAGRAAEVVDDHLELDLVEVGEPRRASTQSFFLTDQAVARRPAHELEGTGADRLVGVAAMPATPDRRPRRSGWRARRGS